MIVRFTCQNSYQQQELTLIVEGNDKYLLTEGRYVKLDPFTIDHVNWYLFLPYGFDLYKLEKVGRWLLDDRAVNYLASVNEAELKLGLGENKVLETSFVDRCLSVWAEEKKAISLPEVIEKLSVPVPGTHGPTVDFTDLTEADG